MCSRASGHAKPVQRVSKDKFYLLLDPSFQSIVLRYGSLDWPHWPTLMDVIGSSGGGA